jgi:hypothetical protein
MTLKILWALAFCAVPLRLCAVPLRLCSFSLRLCAFAGEFFSIP